MSEEIHAPEDKLVKILASNYSQEFLNYLLNLHKKNNEEFIPLPNTKIKNKEPTEIITHDLKTFFMDFAYEMEDGSILNYEHFSGNLDYENLARSGAYVFEKHRENLQKVNTIIVSTGDPEKSKKEVWAGEIVKFNPIWLIFLREHDGREKLKNIENKVKNKQELTLFEAIDLVFMVFFDHDQTPEEIIEKICYLAGKITNPSPKQAGIIHWGLTLIIHRFKKDPKEIKRLKRLKRMINMNEGTIHDLMHDVLEYERQEARQEAIEENKMEIANTMINKGIPTNQIAEITKLDINTIKQLNIGK